MRACQLLAAHGQGIEQLLERIAELQAAQARGVWRTDVDRDVTGVGVHLVQADQVVIDGTLHRGVEILADVDAQHAVVTRSPHPAEQVINAQVVEAHAVDDGRCLRQAEQPRLGVARLRARGDGADFDEAEAQLGETVDGRAVLVQAGRQAHRVGEVQAHDRNRQSRRLLAQHAVEAKTATGADQVQGQVVGGFRGKLEQQLAGQGIHGRARLGVNEGAIIASVGPA
ncbi:hypothetical protein D3C78_453110 [compost metagenome]